MITKLSRNNRITDGVSRDAGATGRQTHRPILMIEDDAHITQLVATELRDAGFEIECFADAKGGLQRFNTGEVQLVILDLTLPDLDGLRVCEHMRRADRFVPILMLTARASKNDIVRGLELGADDYMTKPFDSLELIARVRALLRRIAEHGAQKARESLPDPIRVGPLLMNEVTREAHMDGKLIDLTAKEFELLLVFAKHPGRPFTRDRLLGRVWGEGFEGYEHTVNTHINRLRNKMGKASNRSSLIETVWGVGYRIPVQSNT
jgi:DNA-binding response OmpR family regulator